MDNNDTQVTILLVEDDDAHAILMERNLRRAGVENDIVRVADGQKAVDYLFSGGEYEEQTPASPLVVFLDLNLPILDGYVPPC